MRYLSFFIVIISFSIQCTDRKKTSHFNDGYIDSLVYHNDYFGFQIPLSNNWSLQDPNYSKILIEKANQYLDKDNRIEVEPDRTTDEGTIAIIESSEQTEVYDPTLSIYAVKIKDPQVSVEDYIDNYFEDLLDASDQSMTFVPEKNSVKRQIDGVTFSILTNKVSRSSMPQTIQVLHIAKAKEYFLVIAKVYNTDKESSALDLLMNQITFTKGSVVK